MLEIQRARVGSHPISHDLMRFTVQRVNGVVELHALYGEYLPPATPWLDAELSACPSLDEALAEQVVLDSQFMYSMFINRYYIGSGTYSPNALDTIGFAAGASCAWAEDPMFPRVLFTKSTQGRLVLDSANCTPELLQSDANCPDDSGQASIGFRLTMDAVTTQMVGYQAGLDCVVCLGGIPYGTGADELLTDGPETAEQEARSCACGRPSNGLWATFQVGSETFKQKITSATAIADAIAVWRGQSNKTIPVGSLNCSCASWNCGWSFAMDPATLVMASSAIEICDGLPSYVNETCANFGGGYYCPWSAVMVDLRDCRTNPACPVVNR